MSSAAQATTDYSEDAMLHKVLASNTTNEDAIDSFVSSTAAQDTEVMAEVADSTGNKDVTPSSAKDEEEEVDSEDENPSGILEQLGLNS